MERENPMCSSRLYQESMSMQPLSTSSADKVTRCFTCLTSGSQGGVEALFVAGVQWQPYCQHCKSSGHKNAAVNMV